LGGGIGNWFSTKNCWSIDIAAQRSLANHDEDRVFPSKDAHSTSSGSKCRLKDAHCADESVHCVCGGQYWTRNRGVRWARRGFSPFCLGFPQMHRQISAKGWFKSDYGARIMLPTFGHLPRGSQASMTCPLFSLSVRASVAGCNLAVKQQIVSARRSSFKGARRLMGRRMPCSTRHNLLLIGRLQLTGSTQPRNDVLKVQATS
jgi:hypothetical protein